MDLSSFITDEKLELEGVKIPTGDGGYVLVARLGNDRYQEFVEKALKPYKNVPRSAIPSKDMESIITEGMARHVLLGWDGLTEKGQPLPYSLENCRRVLSENKNFRNWIFGLASDTENFKQAEVEEATKNSLSAPAGS